MIILRKHQLPSLGKAAPREWRVILSQEIHLDAVPEPGREIVRHDPTHHNLLSRTGHPVSILGKIRDRRAEKLDRWR